MNLFDAHHGRSFVRRAPTSPTVVLLALVLATVVLMFAGVGVGRDLFGPGAATVWRIGPVAGSSHRLSLSFLRAWLVRRGDNPPTRLLLTDDDGALILVAADSVGTRACKWSKT